MQVSVTTRQESNLKTFQNVLTLQDWTTSSKVFFDNLVKNYTHSFITFKDNQRHSDNALEVAGLMIDFDGTPKGKENVGGIIKWNPEIDLEKSLTLEEIKESLRGYNYFLYTSKSHRKIKIHTKGIFKDTPRALEWDRVHVFMPFKTPIQFNDKKEIEEFSNKLGAVVSYHFPKADQQVKDLARYLFKSPQDCITELNTAENFIDINYLYSSIAITKNTKREINIEGLRGSDEEGNEYSPEELKQALEYLIDNQGLGYDNYQKILAWAKGESDEIKQLTASILSQNPLYDDSVEDILEKIETFSRSDIKYRSINKMCLDINPEYRFKATSKKAFRKQIAIEKLFNTDLIYLTDEPTYRLNFFNDIMGYSLKTKNYYINTKEQGWIAFSKKECDELLAPFKYYNEKTKKYESYFKMWNSNPFRRTFVSIIFDYKAETTQTILNLAPTIKDLPKPINHEDGIELIKPIVEVIRKSLCNDDTKKLEHLMTWMAYVVDFQQTKIGMQIKGVPGTGKSSLADFLSRFLPKKAVFSTALAERITTNFNSHLSGVSLLVSEEATFSGSYTLSDIIKNLITSPTLDIEYKRVDEKVVLDNFINMLFLSNRDLITKIEGGDRRMVVLETSTDYSISVNPNKAPELQKMYGDFYRAINDKRAIEYFQFVFSLYRQKHSLEWLRDPNNFKTDEKVSSVEMSLDPIDSFLLSLAQNGFIVRIESQYNNVGNISTKREDIDGSKEFFKSIYLYETFVRTSGNSGRYIDLQRFLSPLIKNGLIVNKAKRGLYGELDNQKLIKAIILDSEKIIDYFSKKGIVIQQEDIEEIENPIDTKKDDKIGFKTDKIPTDEELFKDVKNTPVKPKKEVKTEKIIDKKIIDLSVYTFEQKISMLNKPEIVKKSLIKAYENDKSEKGIDILLRKQLEE